MSKMYGKVSGEWVPVYPEPYRGAAPVLSAAPAATEIVYTWTAASGLTVASYEFEFNGVVENVGNVLTVTKTGLTTGQTYTARVRAKSDENVRGAWSNLLSTVAAVPFNAATGGTETTVANYNGTGETWKVHTFTGNGTLTVTKNPQPFRVLLVSGGGAGATGNDTNNGGNGGGVLANDTQALAVQAHAVTIGAGGVANAWDGSYGPSAATVSSLGALVSPLVPAGFTAGAHGYYGGGGGAGSNGNGAGGGSHVGGAGGNGITSTIEGTSKKYAGGGGGSGYSGAGGPGTDGGGGGGRQASAAAGGTANTGGGGGGGGTGGGWQAGSGGSGGSGLVVVAYRIA